jgi:signal transduction histidine kinase/DNA-binding response OmpR family regulator
LTYFVYVTAVLALRVGGMRAPAALVYPPLVVMAGLVWSGRAALGMALLVAAAGAMLATLETLHDLPMPAIETTPWRLWLVMTACVTVTAALIRFALEAIGRAHEDKLSEERRFVAQREQFEQQLREAHKLEALGRLAGGVAHDFNNLLTVILGSVEVLQYKTQAQETADIKQAALRAATLTRQLLAFGRRQVMKADSVDLNRALEHARPLLARLLHEEVRLEIEPARTPCFAIIDRSQLDQVLINLVVNARDAMPSGGTIRVACGHGSPAGGGNGAGSGNGAGGGERAWLSVKDTGVGIAKDALGRIFEPFFTTKRSGLGTGLGLATVHGIVVQSGGAITVQSEVGRGTTFVVALPAGGEPTETAAAPPLAQVPDAAQTRVVVVEDEPALRAVVKAMLEAGGYMVSAPLSAIEALAQIDGNGGGSASSCDLLVTDVVMFGMSGPELARRARAARPELRVLFKAMLEAGGYAVSAPLSAIDALAQIDGNGSNCDLLVTDVVMFGMSGPELARRARQARPELRVLFMSGHADELVEARGALRADVQFVAKPFTSEALLRRVAEVLAQPA